MTWRSPVLRVLLCFSLLSFLSATVSANKKKPPTKPVNINTATSEELQQVPGIGPATAQKILQMRKSYGPFKSVDDLLAIRGLGEKRLDKMRKYLTVGKANSPKTEAPSPKTSVLTIHHYLSASISASYGQASCLLRDLLQMLAP